VDAFTGGFLSLASSARVSLAGGDTTRGERSVTVTLLGVLAADLALTRSGARPGDRIVVSGCPGLAAWALQERLAGRVAARAAEDALDRPTPRLALGAALAGQATACIDVSDGLLADLAHVAKASGCGAELQLDALPGHAAFSGLADPQRWDLQLGGGDDYELCFCLPAENLGCLPDLAHRLGLCLSDIGEMTDGPELVCRSPDGRVYTPRRPGFVHFETPGGSS
jgi:thiamine-monophosphate kinase